MLEELGRLDVIKGEQKVNFAVAKGAAEVVGLAAKITRLEGAKLLGFEVPHIITNMGKRYYDLIAEINGVVYRIESKSWIPTDEGTLKRLVASLGGKNDVDDIHDKGGQLWKDLVDAIRNAGNPDAPQVRWIFDDRMTPELLFGKDGNSGFYGAVVDYLKNNKAMQESLMKATDKTELLRNKELALEFINEEVPDILKKLFTSPL